MVPSTPQLNTMQGSGSIGGVSVSIGGVSVSQGVGQGLGQGVSQGVVVGVTGGVGVGGRGLVSGMGTRGGVNKITPKKNMNSKKKESESERFVYRIKELGCTDVEDSNSNLMLIMILKLFLSLSVINTKELNSGFSNSGISSGSGPGSGPSSWLENVAIWIEKETNAILNKFVLRIQKLVRRSLFRSVQARKGWKNILRQGIKEIKSAILIQSIIRQFLSRLFVIKKAQIFLIKYDPYESDSYWHNPRTGTTSWNRPKILLSRIRKKNEKHKKNNTKKNENNKHKNNKNNTNN